MIELDSSRIEEEGLIMEVEVMPSLDCIKGKGWGKSEIPIVRIKALFDTGARVCAVDKTIIDELKVTIL